VLPVVEGCSVSDADCGCCDEAAAAEMVIAATVVTSTPRVAEMMGMFAVGEWRCGDVAGGGVWTVELRGLGVDCW
jgi:hypothetical protein